MAKDHSHKSAVEPTGGSTLEVVDVDRKPSYPVAALEPKHVEPHSFDSMTQVVTYLRDKLRDTPLVLPRRVGRRSVQDAQPRPDADGA